MFSTASVIARARSSFCCWLRPPYIKTLTIGIGGSSVDYDAGSRKLLLFCKVCEQNPQSFLSIETSWAGILLDNRLPTDEFLRHFESGDWLMVNDVKRVPIRSVHLCSEYARDL